MSAPSTTIYEPCDLCGGEGVVGGLLVGDSTTPVDERCGRCGGQGVIVVKATGAEPSPAQVRREIREDAPRVARLAEVTRLPHAWRRQRAVLGNLRLGVA
jgi:hypothetical protein